MDYEESGVRVKVGWDEERGKRGKKKKKKKKRDSRGERGKTKRADLG